MSKWINRIPDLLDANENSWAFGGSSCDGRTGKPRSERWVCWLPEAAGNSAAGSLRAGAGTTGSQQTVCRTSASSPASSVGPEHYREDCDSCHPEGLQFHVLPTDDPLRALNILREAAGLQPLSDEQDDQGGPSVSP
jgi:hypothetical protein